MATLDILRTVIDAEPANAERTDRQVFDWLRESVPQWQDVPWLEVGVWLHTQGITREALQQAATSGTAANRTAAQHLLDVITAGQPLSATDQRVRDLLAASSLTSAQKAALLAVAQVEIPRHRQAGWFSLTLGNVEAARLR